MPAWRRHRLVVCLPHNQSAANLNKHDCEFISWLTEHLFPRPPPHHAHEVVCVNKTADIAQYRATADAIMIYYTNALRARPTFVERCQELATNVERRAAFAMGTHRVGGAAMADVTEDVLRRIIDLAIPHRTAALQQAFWNNASVANLASLVSATVFVDNVETVKIIL